MENLWLKNQVTKKNQMENKKEILKYILIHSYIKDKALVSGWR